MTAQQAVEPGQDGATSAVRIELPTQLEGRGLLALRQQLLTGLRPGNDLVVDCRNVQAVSFAGQAVLVAADRAARRRGGHLRLLHPSDVMVTAFRSTGLSHLLAGPATPGNAPQDRHDG